MENAKTADAGNKKLIAAAKRDHELHVLLVQKQDAQDKSTAVLTAYREGVAGLEKRLGK